MRRVVLVVPVHNEERVLEGSVAALARHMSKNARLNWRIVIADNASTDETGRIGRSLARRHKRISYVFMKQKGRGAALRRCWSGCDADVYAYCDVDLSTDISSLNRLFRGILGGNDIVIGNRYLRGSNVERGASRELLSRSYNLLARLMVGTRITDLQCGFKAVGKRIVKKILPEVRSTGWFFDTEMLLLAEHDGGYRILQIPVRWREDPMATKRESKVDKIAIVGEYIRSLSALRKRLRG